MKHDADPGAGLIEAALLVLAEQLEQDAARARYYLARAIRAVDFASLAVAQKERPRTHFIEAEVSYALQAMTTPEEP